MDKRRDERFPIHFRSVLSSTNIGDYVGIALDLSPRGCRIQSEMTILVGMRLALRITVPDQNSPIQIERGTVRWSKGQEFGVEFIAIRSRDGERLRQLIQTLGENPRLESL
ncbi:MAG: PilZ domain-containing protein [Nitrospiraceae bacterium]